MTCYDFAQISPTAKLVAEMRRHSDIPYAEAIAERLNTSRFVQEMMPGETLSDEVLRWMGPLAEARYKSLAREISLAGVSQVLELASGFSFRGAAMCVGSSLRYVETDLPEVHRARVQLRQLLENEGVLPRLTQWRFESANAMNAEELERVATLHLESKPVAVVHEGLFQYLTLDEKKTVAVTLRGLLQRYGGVWITPDLETQDDVMKAQWTHGDFQRLVTCITTSVQRDLGANAFESTGHVTEFFGELGFRAQRKLQIDGSFTLASAERLGSRPEQLAYLRESRVIWVLTPS
jgi:O-methyltransferase involved in polyketide biosynthesis